MQELMQKLTPGMTPELTGKFERVYVDQAAVGSRLHERVRGFFPADKVKVVPTLPLPRGELSAAEFSRSKRLLYLTPFKGHFFKAMSRLAAGFKLLQLLRAQLGPAVRYELLVLLPAKFYQHAGADHLQQS